MEYRGRSKLKICLTNFTGEKGGGGIALFMKTDARESKCWKIYLHNLDGKKDGSESGSGGEGGGNRQGKIR